MTTFPQLDLGDGFADAAPNWLHESNERIRAADFGGSARDWAFFFARTHPRAADYLIQAPILAIYASSQGAHLLSRRMFSNSVLEFVKVRFAKRVKDGPKLKTLMAQYRCPYPLRRLRAKILTRSLRDVFMLLGPVPPSVLAQAIPTRLSAQMSWLGMADAWLSAPIMIQRPEVAWWGLQAAGTYAQAFSHTERKSLRGKAHDLLDAMQRGSMPVDVRWTWPQALAAMERWHDGLAERKAMEAAAKAPDWRTPIDYGGLPLQVEIDGLKFEALNTLEKLALEGARMRHCVISYHPDVVAGRCRIYGLRDAATGERIATLEIQPTQHHAGWKVAQMKGPRNSQPYHTVQWAALRFVGDLPS